MGILRRPKNYLLDDSYCATVKCYLAAPLYCGACKQCPPAFACSLAIPWPASIDTACRAGRLFRKLYDLYPMPKYVCLKCSLFIEIISPPMTCDDCAARANFWRYTAILRAGHNNYPLSTFSVSTQIQPRQCVLRRDKPTIAKHDCLSAVTGKTHSI